jgi:hypothetical protein
VHVIDVSVLIIIYVVIWYFTSVGPEMITKILVIEIDARINNGDENFLCGILKCSQIGEGRFDKEH